jgi:hypothetical protein
MKNQYNFKDSLSNLSEYCETVNETQDLFYNIINSLISRQRLSIEENITIRENNIYYYYTNEEVPINYLYSHNYVNKIEEQILESNCVNEFKKVNDFYRKNIMDPLFVLNNYNHTSTFYRLKRYGDYIVGIKGKVNPDNDMYDNSYNTEKAIFFVIPCHYEDENITHLMKIREKIKNGKSIKNFHNIDTNYAASWNDYMLNIPDYDFAYSFVDSFEHYISERDKKMKEFNNLIKEELKSVYVANQIV